MYRLVKNPCVRFKDLCQGDSFMFGGDKHLVLEIIGDEAICYNYRTHSTVEYLLNDQRVKPINCACAQCESEFEAVEVNSLSELRIGDIFKYTMNWQVFLGKSDDGTQFVSYDLITGDIRTWCGYCNHYEKVVDSDVEFIFEKE